VRMSNKRAYASVVGPCLSRAFTHCHARAVPGVPANGRIDGAVRRGKAVNERFVFAVHKAGGNHPCQVRVGRQCARHDH
jgi:hypothetical protein